MSKRAEEAALKAYPQDGDNPISQEGYRLMRAIYAEGYEQAEKDIIERAVAWLKDYVKYFEIYDEKGVEEFRKAMEDEQ